MKNVPRSWNEQKLRTDFSQKGEITDVRLLRTESGNSRKLAFIGYRTESEASAAVKHFNRTYLGASQIAVEPAFRKGDDRIGRPWSKYSKGSSRYESLHPGEIGGDAPPKTDEEAGKEMKPKGEQFVLDEAVESHPLWKEFRSVAQRSGHFWANDGADEGENANISERKMARRKGSHIRFGGDAGQQNDAAEAPTSERNEGSSDEEYQDLSASPLRSSATKTPRSEEGEKKKKKKDKKKQVPKECDDDDAEEKEVEDMGSAEQPSEEAAAPEQPHDTARLFVRNLSYQTSEADVRAFFVAAELDPSDLHVVTDTSTKMSRGLAYVRFPSAERAQQALEKCDGAILQGRILHVMPSFAAKELPPALAKAVRGSGKSSYKKRKENELKLMAANEKAWNPMYMQSNAVIDAEVAFFYCRLSGARLENGPCSAVGATAAKHSRCADGGREALRRPRSIGLCPALPSVFSPPQHRSGCEVRDMTMTSIGHGLAPMYGAHRWPISGPYGPSDCPQWTIGQKKKRKNTHRTR